MTDNPNELSIENTAVVLIDHQPWVAFGVQSIDRGVLINNVTGLARAAKTLGVPTVLTMGAEWAPDFTSPERNVLNEVVLQHGGGVALAAEYVIAQVSAGLVPAPTWATEPEPAR